MTDKQTGRDRHRPSTHTERERERERETETDRQTDRQTDRDSTETGQIQTDRKGGERSTQHVS